MRNLINILDFSVEEIDDLCSLATDIYNDPDSYKDACRGKILGSLFFEPSTRTRLSFTSAMICGGVSSIIHSLYSYLSQKYFNIKL